MKRSTFLATLCAPFAAAFAVKHAIKEQFSPHSDLFKLYRDTTVDKPFDGVITSGEITNAYISDEEWEEFKLKIPDGLFVRRHYHDLPVTDKTPCTISYKADGKVYERYYFGKKCPFNIPWHTTGPEFTPVESYRHIF